MFISRQPLRVSLVGGGIDFPEHFKDNYVATLGFSINRYVYTQFSWQVPIFENRYRLGFSKASYHEQLDDISNPLVREIYKYFNISNHCEVQTLSDLPNTSGLGGSSSFCLGLLDILNHTYNLNLSISERIQLAVELERKSNNFRGGVQDQYHIGNPGLKLIEYFGLDDVRTKDLSLVDEIDFFKSCALIYEKKPSKLLEGTKNRGIGARGLTPDILTKMSELCEQAGLVTRKKNLLKNDLRFLFVKSCELKRSYDNTYLKNSLTEYFTNVGIKSWKYCGAPGSNSIFILENPETINYLKKRFELEYHFINIKFGYPHFIEI